MFSSRFYLTDLKDKEKILREARENGGGRQWGTGKNMVNCSSETMRERQWNHINKDQKMGGSIFSENMKKNF